jgi:hypothetical protein
VLCFVGEFNYLSRDRQAHRIHLAKGAKKLKPL